MIEYVVGAWLATNICRHPAPDLVCLRAEPLGAVKYTLPDGELVCIESTHGVMGAMVAIEKTGSGYRVTIPPHARICKAPVS